ncbi:MAG: class I poly(R)-hydroxyalkanoic acid synthase [Rhodospirillales bacterium]|nr:class I poly(R)-hydroxyalkanoic acid synthase [Rhodospirillales bacterium]MDE0378555.1 class I poly(R)-hydroxyalkanoic acid synthase [Rhodospirillales bacterium]
MAEHLGAIAAQSRRLAERFLTGQGAAGAGANEDPLNLGGAFMAMAKSLAADPSPLVDAQMKWWDGYLRLWQQSARRLQGEEPPEPVAEPLPDDRRFRDPAWSENWIFDHLKQSYLLTAACVQSAAADVQVLDEKDAAKLAFYSRQFVDALAPTNFLATNPAALRETAETKGENLLRGLRNVLDDLERNEGRFAPKMSDEGHFTLGETIATTPGKIVFQNDLMQLIQYAPSTETVFRRPLLVVPPWINKYYVLDLRPKNSFVRWAVSKGYTVFMISWVNPDGRLAEKTFEDYMLEGPLAALDAIEQATGERDVAAIGYCLGGTLTAATLAYLAARGDQRIRSATFFASLVDFAEPGDLGVFIDDAQIESLEAMMAEKGYLEGRHMATTFNMLRANDLIWSFVVNNYLLGREPMPFDLLFWNADSTRMPAAMHAFYLHEMYRKNLLAEPGGLSLAGVPIDLGRIEIPTYIVATREDHIAPWQSCFAACGLYGGKRRFVLGASGHIAGIINPPAAGKYGYWTGPVEEGQDAAAWLAAAEQHEGSWWNDWHTWQSRRGGGKKVLARVPGTGGLRPIEDAPGSYVRAA